MSDKLDKSDGSHEADQAWAMVAELISAIVTWAGIGWLLDRWLDTTPWLLLIGIVIGGAAGFYLVLLRSNRMMASASKTAGRSPGDGNTTEGAARGMD
jgi:F0F1-type ATP synthase assembly protein I